MHSFQSSNHTFSIQLIQVALVLTHHVYHVSVIIQVPLPSNSVIDSAALSFTAVQAGQTLEGGVAHESTAGPSECDIFETISPGQLEER
jgi:hypothetical protein